MEEKLDKDQKHQELIKKYALRNIDINNDIFDDDEKEANVWVIIAIVVIFLLALAARLYFIFKVSNPDNPGAGWFGDAYHHWQIAYLSQEIGFKQGFLRLWDLKGMEFFWGLAHPLFTIFAFFLSNSVTVGSERAMTAFLGSVSVVLIFLIVRKFWNTSAAIASSLFAALNPVGVFNDSSGMVEPIGIPFLLLGVLLWPKKPFWAGFVLFIALTARAEYWVFSLALVLAMVTLTKKIKSGVKPLVLSGFFIPLFIYMKYLLFYTGNLIYPLYWNYVANIFGTWQLKTVLEPQDILGKFIFLGIFVVSLLSSLLVIKKKPKGMYLYLLGIGNWLFLGATFGLGQYIKSYATYVWYVRFMIWPYAFLGIVVSIFLFYWIPKSKLKFIDTIKLNWLISLAVLLAVQPVWKLIWDKYSTTNANWEAAINIANKIAPYYETDGKLLFIEGNPEITYALVRKNKIEGKNIVSEMFDPYFYFEDEEPYKNWGENRIKVLNWIKDENIKTVVTYANSERYINLVKYESKYFSHIIPVEGTNLIIFQVNENLFEDTI